MKNNRINFKVLLRSPEYPVIIISDNDVWAASNIEELGTICVISEVLDEDILKVVDCTGEEFWYIPNQYSLTPGFSTKKWTKKQIIDLYNNSEASKESNIQYSYKSLSSKRVSKIVTDICNILSNNQLLHEV